MTVESDARPPERVCDVEDCNAWKTGEIRYCHHHKGLAEGGAPENNDNAQKHSLYADNDKLYERLSDERKEIVDSIVESLTKRYKSYHGRSPDMDERMDFFDIGMLTINRFFVRDYMAEQWAESGNPMLEHVEMEKDGEQIEFEKPIELLDEVTDTMREGRLLKKHAGLFKDPESEKAESNRDLGEMMREALEPQD